MTAIKHRTLKSPLKQSQTTYDVMEFEVSHINLTIIITIT